MTTPPEVLALSGENPAWGCVRLSGQLQLEGISLSSPTVQAILIKHGQGTRYERLLRLEERMATEPITPTAEQIRLIEEANPCFRERHAESSRPGELLAQDTFYVAAFKGLGKLYLQAVVDTFGRYAFATLHTIDSKAVDPVHAVDRGRARGLEGRPETAALILHNEVLPFYAQRGLPVGAVLTDKGREFCGDTRTNPPRPNEPTAAACPASFPNRDLEGDFFAHVATLPPPPAEQSRPSRLVRRPVERGAAAGHRNALLPGQGRMPAL